MFLSIEGANEPAPSTERVHRVDTASVSQHSFTEYILTLTECKHHHTIMSLGKLAATA